MRRGAQGSEPSARPAGERGSRPSAPRRATSARRPVLRRRSPRWPRALRSGRRVASPAPPLQSSPADVASPDGSGSFTPAATPEPAPSSTYPPGTGGRVYAENCSGCHGARGEGSSARRWPRPASPASSAPWSRRAASACRRSRACSSDGDVTRSRDYVAGNSPTRRPARPRSRRAATSSACTAPAATAPTGSGGAMPSGQQRAQHPRSTRRPRRSPP